MSPIEIGFAGIVLLFILLLVVKVPVGIGMIIVSIVGNMLLSTPANALAKFGSDLILLAENYNLSVIPLFVLMGIFVSEAGFVSDLYDIINSIVGKIRGGMAIATIGAGAAFGAVCGSAVACASTVASVSVPEMCRHDYDPGFAASVAAVGSTLGIVIPPSTTLVLYGVLTEESIGQILIGGFLPGIITALLLMITSYVMVRRNPKLAPKQAETVPFSWEKFKNIWAIPLIFIISFGGIYLGFFTPTEAGAVGAFSSLLFALVTRKLKVEDFVEALSYSCRVTAMVFVIIIGGMMFGAFLTRSLIPMWLTSYIEALNAPPWMIMFIILAIYTIMGCFIDALAAMVIMTPVLYPVIISLGYNGVWFGVVTAMMLLTGLLTPPVGVSSLVVASVTKIPSTKIFKAQLPFLLTLIVSSIIMIFFPDIILFLPRMMY
ncbi:MAG TPA: TRAP transporter large permease [Thermoanaerobacterales bacterium]|jgi:tripartite ATP-independent transporter DctM subunit|nr:TRAP transporter large permease [Thermoanaerobacterales bacterium]